ncbi:asparaginase [Salmonella enterica subsp. enterica]|nr:asparaginase [Salmonella enterica subsp. enterica]
MSPSALTAGTIAGGGDSAKSNYTAGKKSAFQHWWDAVPQLKDIVVKGEQVVNIGSQDMNDEVWLTLAKNQYRGATAPTVS